LGLCSILPNILPLAAIGFLLRATGQPLQYISALALTMCLGIAVDDTIHYLYRYRSATGAGMNALAAVHDATRRVGAALCASTIVLVAGLVLLQVSSLPMVRRFSLLCIITLVIALLADLVVLPALLLLAPGKPAPQTNPRK